MQYKVPQNIDLEDRIVGPFTMRQFIYMLAGGAVIYGWWNFANSYTQPPPMAIFLPLAAPLGFLTLCFTLIKINDRPFEVFFLSLLRFLFSPKRRMWQEGYIGDNVIMLDKDERPKDDGNDLKKAISLDDLSKTLEQQAGSIKAQQAPAAPAKGSVPKAPPASSGAATPPAATTPASSAPTATTSQDQVAKTGLNLSVADVKGAAEKQAQAQLAPHKPSKGFLGIFK